MAVFHLWSLLELPNNNERVRTRVTLVVGLLVGLFLSFWLCKEAEVRHTTSELEFMWTVHLQISVAYFYHRV